MIFQKKVARLHAFLLASRDKRGEGERYEGDRRGKACAESESESIEKIGCRAKKETKTKGRKRKK